jgi:hypothetical protein
MSSAPTELRMAGAAGPDFSLVAVAREERMSNPRAAADAVDFSLARQDALHDVQRAGGLIPDRGFGLIRRIALYVLVAWVPLLVWALVNRRAFEGIVAEPLLQHFAVHARFLIGIPLLLAAEPFAESIGRRTVLYLQSSGLLADAERARFAEIITESRRVLRSRYALAVIVGIAFFNALLASLQPEHLHELDWATTLGQERHRLAFGAWWYVWVSRPIYAVLLLNWIWRLVVTAILLGRVARLDLQLVPTHPDGCAGLGFLQNLPTAFVPVIVAASAALSSHWGHDVLYHGVALQSLRVPAAVFVGLVVVLFLGPLLAFVPKLAKLRQDSLLAYGALVGRHGRLVDRRWIRREQVDDDGLLSAPELGPVADTLTLYQAVAAFRPVPIGRRAVLVVAAAALLPMVPVVAIRVPLKEQIFRLIQTLL